VNDNTYIGSAVERVEDLRFLRGRGEYVDDLHRDGLLHAAILRSQVAHGHIRSIDLKPALACSGVHCAFAAADLGPTTPMIPMRLQVSAGVERFFQPVLATSKVRYVGEPLAVVLAESPALAEDALEAIQVDIEILPVVNDWRNSAADDHLLFESAGTNLAKIMIATKGDAEAAFAAAPHSRRETFRTQRHTASPMETRGLMAEWDAAGGRVTVSGAAKVPFFNRKILAGLIGLDESAISMIENDVGGGFGARGEFYPEDFLIPFAARLARRPVKWIEDRRECLLAMNHAREMEADLEVAYESDGRILGLRGRVFVDNGAYLRTNGLTAPNNVSQVMSGPYKVPNIHLESVVQLTNKTPCGTYRGPGRFEAAFFFERLLDLIAHELQIDRVEIRRRNLISESDMPYRLAEITPEHPYSRTECDSGNYLLTLDRCLAEFDWVDRKRRYDGKLIEGRYHGLGITCFVEGGAAGPRENARLAVEADGRVCVYVGSSALGQGLETVFAQIAADALGLPMTSISGVRHGSTSHVEEGFGSFHSRAVVMGGSAIVIASEKLKATICETAARLHNCPVKGVRFVDGEVLFSNGGRLALRDLSEHALMATGTFSSNKNTYAYGAHAAHVAVDPKTGGVEVIDYLAVEDVGRIINPATLHGQVLGALVQGLGSTLLEHFIYDTDGQLLTGSFADYLTPTMTDFARLRAISIEALPSPNNPLGAKGAGEGGIIAVGGTIANAVAAALATFNVQPHDLPLSPARVWELIGKAPKDHRASRQRDSRVIQPVGS